MDGDSFHTVDAGSTHIYPVSLPESQTSGSGFRFGRIARAP